MSSPRFWKICQFNPSDIFKCVGPVDRTVPSYEEITVETVNEVFNRIIVSSPMNFFNTDDATRSLIERVDSGEEQVSVHYHVVLDFNGVNSAADLAKDRQAIIDAIENW